MLCKLTEAGNGNPFYVNADHVIVIDAPSERTNYNGRIRVAGIDSPAYIRETPAEAFEILCPLRPNGTRTTF